MKKQAFRAYDIRGIIGTDIAIDDMPALSTALAIYITQRLPQAHTIVVGRDNRTHSPLMSQKLIETLCKNGFSVIDLGIVPTPVLYFALHTIRVDAGIMITASHNGPEYNGLKICLGTQSIWGEELLKIYQLACKQEYIVATTPGTLTAYNIIPAYIAQLTKGLTLTKPSKKIVVDCGEGAAAYVIPALIDALGWYDQCVLLCTTLGNEKPTHLADPSVPENCADLQEAVQTHNASLGIAFDGDGDRMGAITDTGEYVAGDKLTALFAQDILQTHPQAPIIYDIKCSQLLEQVITESDGIPTPSPSGHSIIKETMQKIHSPFGGELSGHFFFKDRWFGCDDGMYAGLRLIELIQRTKKTLATLVAELPKKYSSREFRIPCPDTYKQQVIVRITNSLKLRPGIRLTTIDGVAAYTDHGWGLIRASNTQPLLSLRGESDTPEGLAQITNELFSLIAPYISHTEQFKEQL